MKLIFATNNKHKLEELRFAVGDRLQILSLEDAGITREIPEPFDTLKENAQIKAATIHDLTGGENCFSEDTGLEVDALGGQPGVQSARYAGEPVSYANNTRKLLQVMGKISNRQARFITIICLIFEGREYFFEGRCEGEILNTADGDSGFGYDPIFKPAGAARSFAKMSASEKNIYSHRRKAVDLLIAFLKTGEYQTAHAQN